MFRECSVFHEISGGRVAEQGLTEGLWRLFRWQPAAWRGGAEGAGRGHELHQHHILHPRGVHACARAHQRREPTRPRGGEPKTKTNNITSFHGSSCANNGKDALNTPEAEIE
eukprot:1175412-Prorocentrum_minimum.AAC.2